MSERRVDCAIVELSELEKQANELVEALQRLEAMQQPVCPEPWLQYLAEVGRGTARLQGAAKEVTNQLGLTNARDRLLMLLQSKAGEEVEATALESVAGIRAWPRRIRELREAGWPIESRGSGAFYILHSHDWPDSSPREDPS